MYPKGYNILFGVDEDLQDHTALEILAVTKSIQVLSTAKQNVTIYTDYILIEEFFNFDYYEKWSKQNWKRGSTKESILYREYWEELKTAKEAAKANITIKYVPGHSNIPGNMAADIIASAVAKYGGVIPESRWKKIYDRVVVTERYKHTPETPISTSIKQFFKNL